MIIPDKIDRQQGFTLVELMIVVAIIGVLAAVAYPTYVDQVYKTRRVEAINALTLCAAQQGRAYTVSNTFEMTGLCDVSSPNGSYTVAVDFDSSDALCGAAPRINCFEATATVATGESQAGDLECKSFTITHLGAKSAVDSSDTDATENCWRD